MLTISFGAVQHILKIILLKNLNWFLTLEKKKKEFLNI
jgi:hypothetical protein